MARATRPRLSNPKGLPVQKKVAHTRVTPPPPQPQLKINGRLCGQGQEWGVCLEGTEGVL